jgi:hypothetical protein
MPNQFPNVSEFVVASHKKWGDYAAASGVR